MNFSHFLKLREEPLKNAIQEEFFDGFRYTQLGNIDFVIAEKRPDNQGNLFGLNSFLWAEAKKGNKCDLYESFVQLILTIGKEKTFEKELPPRFIGALDAERIAFIEYNDIQGVFYQNDFNWNVTPSDHNTKEFKQLYENCQKLLEKNTFLFNFGQQEKELREFIRKNFNASAEETVKIAVTKNNFTFVFRKWSEKVLPTIGISWDAAKRAGIISADFFLADLISKNDESIKDNLYVVLKKTRYEYAKKTDELGEISRTALFNDRQKAYREFWAIYERPPKEEYWDYIIGRRDLLVPQDIRERKGSFFTPQIWVEKSQQYIADVLGENWQDEYYVWDCCAGTGNLLDGLTNKYKIFASTLDQADVDVMKDRVKNGWNMLENHIFQFDFLNDEFTKCPEALQKIINDPEKRKKLLIYINPPYAEVSSHGKKGKAGVNQSKIHDKYSEILSGAGRELSIQFIWRIYKEISGCIIGEFSTLKILLGPSCSKFRTIYKAKLLKMFCAPAFTFDNLQSGQFPIGFKIWDTAGNEEFHTIISDVFNQKGNALAQKVFSNTENVINKWVSSFKSSSNTQLGFLCGTNGNDFQQNNIVYILNKKEQMANPRGIWITSENLTQACVYMAVRKSINQIESSENWLQNKTQFLSPIDGLKEDNDFQRNSLVYVLFHEQNNITCTQGTNHWIPFTEDEVGAREEFESHFMSDYLKGKIDTQQTGQADLFSTKQKKHQNVQIQLSPEAQKVFDTGRELYRYYHSKPDANPNASLYDIKEYFQGRNDKGRMNAKSDDEQYTKLLNELKAAMKALGEKIKPKVYEYGFLK